ncbi:MAG: hypothetical protein KDD69_06940 [Bdellovibrionales bacterium]|nr:hypothetical protein [Bdellovibrionales bacterium]
MTELPAGSRLWVFPLSSALTAAQEERLARALTEWIVTWKAHGSSVSGGFELYRSRFVLVAATEEQVQVSGCSIDSLFRQVQQMLAEIAVPLADMSSIFYLEGAVVKQVSRSEFKALAADGAVSETTIVFDCSLQHLDRFRDGAFELPVSACWHKQLLPK